MHPDYSLEVTHKKGGIHLITQTIEEIKSFFFRWGFELHKMPHLVSEEENFDSLNVPSYHPSRDKNQTFYIDKKLLRTHNTCFQTHVLKNWDNKSEIRAFNIGPVFRRDHDATHTPMFHQIDVMYMGDDANICTLLWTLKSFLTDFFEKPTEIRFRPSFFPFTTPSYEVDGKIYDKWVELLGAGIMHEEIFNYHHKKFKNGFAFGCGVERISMIKYHIEDIRVLYEGDLRYLQNIYF